MWKPCFSLIILLLLSAALSAQTPTASEILNRVNAVYSSCRSYSDEGVTNSGISGRGRRTSFRTSFVRTDAFRFELWLSGRPGVEKPWVLWKKGDTVKSVGNSAGLAYADSPFDTVLLRMAGLSGGGSLTVPQLLLGDLFRVSDLFSLLANPKVTGEEKINGRPAFRIEATLWDLPVTIWIDKSEYLVLKTYRKLGIDNRSEESTVQYKPKINVDIPPENLTLPQSLEQIASSPGPLTPSSPVRDLELPPRLKAFGWTVAVPPKADRITERPAADDDDVVRVDTDLVVCPVLVVDGQGRIVKDLRREDFIVKEDDKLQEVATLSLGDNRDVPRSIVLVIDYSGSQLPYIQTSIQSAKTLVDKLNPKDRMAVVTDDVKLLVDFTSDKQLLKTELDGLKAAALAGKIGASEQYDALLATLNELFSREDVRPIIIFQTDGDELESLKGSTGPPRSLYWFPHKYGMEDIRTAAEQTRASVYAVISGIKFLGIPQSEVLTRATLDWEIRQNANLEFMRVRGFQPPKKDLPKPTEDALTRHAGLWRDRQNALAELAKSTGTIPEFLEKPGEADEIYTRVLSDIDRRYVLGYYPTNRLRDGKRRKVSIEVRDHPEYSVWGQRNYFARRDK